jgi:peroxiredoxin
MALTPSTMLSLGTRAPDFSLPDPSDGKVWSLDELLKGKQFATVWFICNHCPYVQHVRHELAKLGREYSEKGVAVVAISANDVVSHPDDAPEAMAREKKEMGYVFPYLHDETQATAQAYQAACTPDFYVFDRDRTLVYRGQLDDSRPGNNIPVTGKDLRAALDAVLAGKPVPENQKPSIGCNIKWKPGNEPSYFG